MRRANGDASRLGAVGLALLATALLAGRLAEGDLIGDPVIYAAVAKSMLVRGEWATQYLAGQPFFDKPPLVAWLAALAFELFGVSTWSARARGACGARRVLARYARRPPPAARRSRRRRARVPRRRAALASLRDVGLGLAVRAWLPLGREREDWGTSGRRGLRPRARGHHAPLAAARGRGRVAELAQRGARRWASPAHGVDAGRVRLPVRRRQALAALPHAASSGARAVGGAGAPSAPAGSARARALGRGRRRARLGRHAPLAPPAPSRRHGCRGDGARARARPARGTPRRLSLEARGDPGALRLLRRSRGRAHGRRSGRAGPPRGRHAGGDRAARRARARGRRPLRGAPPLARLRRLPRAVTSLSLGA